MKAALLSQILAAGLPRPVEEHPFSADRKWRFDLAWPDLLLAVEQEGGTWTAGRHVRPKGFEEDARKYNEAILLGWRVLRFTTAMIASGEALGIIERAFPTCSWCSRPVCHPCQTCKGLLICKSCFEHEQDCHICAGLPAYSPSPQAPADPQAWNAWRRNEHRIWVRLHCACEPQLALELLLEDLPPAAVVAAVLPRDLSPE